jgi:hypothetical protein
VVVSCYPGILVGNVHTIEAVAPEARLHARRCCACCYKAAVVAIRALVFMSIERSRRHSEAEEGFR